MQYRTLGRTGVQVSTLVLGAPPALLDAAQRRR
jgi:aryl-alcohol dehydrogenase-like predicted oxidoreductase